MIEKEPVSPVMSLRRALETEVMGPVPPVTPVVGGEAGKGGGSPKAEPSPRGSGGSLLRTPSSLLEEEEKKRSKRSQWIAWVAAVVVLVVAPLAWLYLPGQFRDEPQQQQAPVQQPVSAPQSTAVAPAPAEPASAQPAPAPLPPSLPGSEEDPAAMVKEWETAMQSSDAARQAAFYADPVDRYFLRHNVSKSDVQADKQSKIDKRQDGWTVTVERVKVQQQPDAATVRLVKHYAVRQNDKVVSQWFVPSQLLLKRADGRWQITSERDLGWGTSLDELDY